MAKAVGIDYGTKRIGISISDSSQIIATSLCAIENKNIFSFLKELLEKEEVDTIVIGEAKNLDTTETDSSKQIYQFVEKLKNQFPKILIKTIDERFTSKIAFQSIIDFLVFFPTIIQNRLKPESYKFSKIISSKGLNNGSFILS